MEHVLSLQTARRLNLKCVPDLGSLSGGAAIERLAREGDPTAVPLTPVMSHMRNCDFSFAGIKQKFAVVITEEQRRHGEWWHVAEVELKCSGLLISSWISGILCFMQLNYSVIMSLSKH